MLNLYTIMERAEKIRLIYSIVVGVFAVALGIAVICVAADIYYSGRGTGVVFTRDIVVARLKAVAIPFIVLVGLIICGAVFPLYEVKAKRKPEDAVRLLSSKKPTGGDGEEYAQAEQSYKKFKLIRYIIWGIAFAATLACAIASLCYLFNATHFKADDITAEIFAMVKNILPCVIVSFAALLAAAIASGVLAQKQLAALKIMIKTGNGVQKEKPPIKWYEKIIAALSGDVALWVVRGAVFVVAVTFIIVGALNGGARDVLIKAINICTECIGLG